MTDKKLIKNTMLKWINKHSEEERTKQYLVTGNKSYTLEEVYQEIASETEFGNKMLENIIALTIDLLLRGKEKINP